MSEVKFPFFCFDEYSNMSVFLPELCSMILEGILRFKTSNAEFESFRLNKKDTEVQKIQLTRRNSLVYHSDERYIRGRSKYWSACGENLKWFPEVIHLINDSSIFLETGRILILYSRSSETPEHIDHNYPDFLQEFIWINLNKKKRFYIKDKMGIKHLTNCSCVWFDSRLPHGTENSDFPALSIRVDGIFKPSLRELIHNYTQ